MSIYRALPAVLAIAVLITLPVAAYAAEDYLAALGPGGRLSPANYSEYTPAFAEFVARGDLSAPVYLGSYHWDRPVPINYRGLNYTLLNYSSPFRAEAGWYYPYYPWNENNSYGPVVSTYRFPDRNGGLEVYHVPSIVDFLDPGYLPIGMNYSGYLPVLGNFAAPGWRPDQNNLSQYVPAIREFLEEDWEPPQPSPETYPQWMIEYLRD